MVVWLVNEEQHLIQLIELARQSPFRTTPNPKVACRIIDSLGRVIAEGVHGESGIDHAEVIALHKAGDLARGATAIVTLEPCAHQGKTPPCTDALIAAGVARVIYGSSDRSQARGGAHILRNAKIEVIANVCESEADALIAPWRYFLETGLPYVTLKIASTLDGYVAAENSSSRWITGADAREYVHRLRASVDAVAVGSGTAAIDDPLLDVRLPGNWPQPARYVIGKRELAASMRLSGLATQIKTHDPREVLQEMAKDGVQHLLLEGGPTTATAFLKAGLVQQVVWCIAPKLLGSGVHAIGDLGFNDISQAEEWRVQRSWQAGADLIIELTR